VEIPDQLRAMVWKKGSWAVNGVSLTVNSVEGGVASHCLIPETLTRTNLGELRIGDLVNVEVDVFARALSQSIETYLADRAERMGGI
jgi:riboflavin synthase